MGVTTAPMPAQIIEKGKLSDKMIVDVIIQKFCDHNPLYRQSAAIFRDAKVAVSRKTMSGIVVKIGSRLRPLVGQMRAELLAGSYMQADETPVGVQDKNVKGKNHQGYMWQYSHPGGVVVFDFQMSRARKGPREFLGAFAGVLQTDGYVAYRNVGGRGMVQAACWAHARRKFMDAQEVASAGDQSALEVIKLVRELYGVEKEAREGKLGAAERQKLREANSAPVLEALKDKVLEVRKKVLPKHALGKACDYTLALWEQLSVYVKNGHVEIDNNWAENAMRPVALGRKNWLHIGSEEAGESTAMLLSIIATCQRIGAPIREYLEDILPILDDWPVARVGELSPIEWWKRRNPVAVVEGSESPPPVSAAA
jgi:hypothetical protein